MCCGGDCVQEGTVPGKHGREEMQMKKIIFDCDNTFGVKDCDVAVSYTHLTLPTKA